ncbi:TonB-dependent receptor domain-containing protein [Alkalimonas amylolytica]|uniref:Outer membrane cobalamin receptor protein n=1 Tax=Alkalimonas amylolytica TaxID=152573 RepID=A0A1H4CN35_ALKAM|nr:TonB-dependent receptor [Alkalimonas amylolytica]SEA61743.1 Outer membrane cobalamin receptor protein [Alkalimonas amylolytica]
MKTKQVDLYQKSIIAIALSTLFTTPALFAEQNEATSEETDSVERIFVTGSRIARDANLASPSPVQSISEEEIRMSGEFSIADVVNDIPALFSSTTSSMANESGFASGTNVLNLRSMGSNRTLVLVNGKRHVGGTQGSSAVDVGSIPASLVRRVEVLTGGASAVYGADAVTGVVNFILRDDFEGFEFDAQISAADEGDAQQYTLDGTWGTNFADNRGNFAVNVSYGRDKGLRANERKNGVLIGSGRDWVNPARRFQIGDLTAGDTPNFHAFYNPSQGRPGYGLNIPGSADAFLNNFEATFGTRPNLTPAELALIDRAANAPQRAILPGRTFPFTSGYGLIAPGNGFTFAGFDEFTPIDLDGNGVPDCLDSFTGWTSSFAPGAFGALGGCWTVQPDGTYRPVQDGLVASPTQGFGGDSFDTIQQNTSYLLIPEERIALNLLGSYDLTSDIVLRGELKYVYQEAKNTIHPTSFWDLLLGAPDNPFLPEFIRPIAEQTGGVSLTIDPIGLGDAMTTNKRQTLRGVVSIDGFLDNGWSWDASAVYGQFTRKSESTHQVIVDRFFSAIDAVTNPATGQPDCRVNVDPTTPAMGTPFNIPTYEPGYFTFTPGDGSCVPLNIWAGRTGVTQEALDWVTRTNDSKITLDQTVLSASLAGDFGDYFELPGGAIAFAAGVEYRRESSKAEFDAWRRGVIPAGAPHPAGSNIADVSSNASLTFRPETIVRNESGSYHVYEAFAELSIPLLFDAPLADELTLDLAARVSDYSTIGNTTTWRANLLWAPVQDLRIRTSYSEAVRAPNITELFGPETGTTFRPADPCDAAQINAIRANDPERANNTQANCVAFFSTIGLDPFDADGNYSFADPLTAAFGGVVGGNPDLREETAETLTVGFVYTPGFLPGFNMSVDYWKISLKDAINAVSGQNIADGCFTGGSLNAQFCELLTRNSDPNSLFFGGFNFMKSTDINFAKREAAGVDFSVGYDFSLGDHQFNARIAGTRLSKLNDFTNPLDLNDVDNRLEENRNPKLAGNFSLGWQYDELKVSWRTQYHGKQLLMFARKDTYQSLYGDAVMMPSTLVHNINASYQWNTELMIYGGINNLTNEEPFITNYAYPVSARGRSIFLGINYRI